MSNQFKIGCNRQIITPPLGTLLYGYTTKRPASKVNDDLCVSAIYSEQNDVSGFLISADICSITKEIVNKIRELIYNETGVSCENVSFSATHTHSGPAIKSSGGWGTQNIEFIENTLIPMTVKAAKLAKESAVPALLGVGTTKSLVGVNRREILPNGEVTLGQNPNEVCDTTMTVLAFKDLLGKNILNVVHYSCHGTAACRCTEITRDWMGVLIDGLEHASGATTVFFNGSEGDMGPRLSNGKTTGETKDLRYVYEIGSLGAYDAIKAFNGIKEYKEVEFNLIKGTVELPYKPILTLEEAKEKLALLPKPEDLVEVQKREYQVLNDTIKLHEQGFEFDSSMKFHQVMFLFNSTIFVPFPFEVFSEIALRLRELSPFENTLSTCNTNDSHFYLPTQKEMAKGGYEIEIFLYANIYKLKNDTDDTIVKENLRIIKDFLDSKN